MSNGRQVVVHEGSDGVNHPLHKICLYRWVKDVSETCPCCRQPLNARSFTFFEEKLRCFEKHALAGGIASAGVGAYLMASLHYPEETMALGCALIATAPFFQKDQTFLAAAKKVGVFMLGNQLFTTESLQFNKDEWEGVVLSSSVGAPVMIAALGACEMVAPFEISNYAQLAEYYNGGIMTAMFLLSTSTVCIVKSGFQAGFKREIELLQPVLGAAIKCYEGMENAVLPLCESWGCHRDSLYKGVLLGGLTAFYSCTEISQTLEISALVGSVAAGVLASLSYFRFN